MAKRKSKSKEEVKAFLLGRAQQKLADTKRQLYDDYDYDRISHAQYVNLLETAHTEYDSTVKRINQI